MTFRLHIHLLALPALAAALLCSGGVAADELEVSADTPDVTVSTRPAGRNFMRLPSLEYSFLIEASCSGGRDVQSFSLSIADTRVSVTAGELAGNGSKRVSVSVPADQIGPVAVNEFCIDDDATGDQRRRTLTVPSVLSAQSALLCGDETGGEMTYASTSLDVSLTCDPANEPQSRTID